MSRYQFSTLTLVSLLLFVTMGLAPVDGLASTTVKKGEDDLIVHLYQKVAPATVFVSSVYFTGQRQMEEPLGGIGSGIILDKDGLILTNAHVVAGAANITVTLHDETALPADLVGLDPVTDLALLRVTLQKRPHPIAHLGDSDHLQIGQRVLAIGHPFGLGFALTTGVVSGFQKVPGLARLLYNRIIQTSAPINPGNSGGPLVDIEGQVIGINTAVLVGAQNIGFAIPINTAKEVVEELRSRGRVVRPWLGISGKPLTDQVIDLFALPLGKGIIIENVDGGSPAEKAGLRKGDLNVTIEGEPWILGGDIVRSINGRQVKTSEEANKVFKSLRVGQEVDLEIIREGDFHKVQLTVQERPQWLKQERGPSGQAKTRSRAPSFSSDTSGP